jgi:phenylacetic acid degradation operon negative regulatory protein
VWVRPDNLAGAPAAVDGVTWVVGARFAEGDDAAALAARLWDTHRWARAAASLRAAMADAPPERDLPASFAVAAAVVRHVRDDPLLPDALLPSGWPGDAIRAEYDDYEARFRASLRALLG